MKFDQYTFTREIKQNLAALGFTKPTDIQYKAIRPIAAGEDVLAIAQTGTGKTAAFAIPIIEAIFRKKLTKRVDTISAVVMCPTRELAAQIASVFHSIEKSTSVTTIAIFGGVDQDRQIRKLVEGVDVLVATPGRMFDLISQRFVDLDYVDFLVLDEADKMLDDSFIRDIRDVKKHLPKKHQTLYFSATINEEIKKLAYSLVHNPIRIQISPDDPVSKNIYHQMAYLEMDDKRFFLERLVYEHPDQKILVFVRTKVRAERVCKALERMGIISETLHGDKLQDERQKSLQKFRIGEIKVLVATDVSARGIDIDSVDYVVNYDLPEVAEYYVHRIGRTGRGTKKGYAISFCSNEEKPLLEEIEAYIGKPIELLSINKEQYFETKDLGTQERYDWKLLIEEDNKANEKPPRKPQFKKYKPKGKKR
jgi:ATP-dependent RNA helicase RhlE